MEELQKTQEYAAEGEERRKRAGTGQPIDNPDAPGLPVSGEDGTGRR